MHGCHNDEGMAQPMIEQPLHPELQVELNSFEVAKDGAAERESRNNPSWYSPLRVLLLFCYTMTLTWLDQVRALLAGQVSDLLGGLLVQSSINAASILQR